MRTTAAFTIAIRAPPHKCGANIIEVFYNQRRRHSTLGQISPAAFERRARQEGVDAMENCPERSFPPRPHPSSGLATQERTTKSDQRNETVH